MSNDATTLAPTVLSVQPMLPARDFDLSRQFYTALGFRPVQLADRLMEMRLGACTAPSSCRTTTSGNGPTIS
jgi:catechol 2,3-dioxygenase-like lactoylglutathione lyase family enzyme